VATRFTVREIVEAALRRLQSYAVHDVGSDPDEFSIAVDALDRMLAHYGAVFQLQFWIKETVAVAIPAATNPLDIVTIAGTATIPTGEFMAIDDLWLRDTTSSRDYPLERISRRKYHEEIENKSQGGMPGLVYIDRTEQAPKVYLHPVMQLTGYELVFTYFKFTNSVRSSPNGAHGFDLPWQLWMETQLAYIIGSGPVIMIEGPTLSRWQTDAREYREQLFAAYNREAKKPRRVEANPF
jgi:hypothetical protein